MAACGGKWAQKYFITLNISYQKTCNVTFDDIYLNVDEEPGIQFQLNLQQGRKSP